MKNIIKGFTLIELLVVVLIIGILSSVALPQYQKSVERARSAEILANVDTLSKNAQMYFLNGETDTITMDDLIVDLGGCQQTGNNKECYTKNGRYWFNCFLRDSKPVCFVAAHRGDCLKGGVGSSYCDWSNHWIIYKFWEKGEAKMSRCYTNNLTMGRYICKGIESLGYEYMDKAFDQE